MADDFLDYGRLIDEAMHIIVHKALRLVADKGLPGDHHFYITFRTTHEGVNIPEELHKQYPEEMTIVLQHQFWDLTVDDLKFSVVLSFNNAQKKLTVPFLAVSSFADPSVKFGLQFRYNDGRAQKKTSAKTKKGAKAKAREANVTVNNVVMLDAFRKDG